jgi:hypothetical protein
MGNLLSSAIKMQNGAVANPTLVVNFTDFAGAGSCDAYKNGSLFGSVTSGTPLTVPIVAGDTFYLIISAPFTGFCSATYYINAVSQGTQTTTSTLTTTTRTATGTNAYSYDVIADLF